MIRALGFGFSVLGLGFRELPEWREKKASLGLIDFGAVFQLLHRSYIGIEVNDHWKAFRGSCPHLFNSLERGVI